MNDQIRDLSTHEASAVAGGTDGYCGTRPPHWPWLSGVSVFEPEPAPWLPVTGFSHP